MPLLRFDLIEGRSDHELKVLLDAAHRAMLAAFNVPPGDRYQIVHQHPAREMIIEDTGLGIQRTRDVVFLQVTTRMRPRALKEDFYRRLVAELKSSCDIEPCDVVVSMVSNTDDDWSFGHGRAQFLTGEL